MKKFFISLACLIAVQIATAGVVTQEEARDKASAFLSGRHIAGQRHGLRLAAKGAQLSVASAQSSYYVFNVGEQQGFVVVSGDDRTPSILGYASQGSFDETDIPENMRSWLQGYADQLSFLESHPQTHVAKASSNDYESIPYLLKSTWNQGSPYNNKCPYDGSNRSVTGCVATAMAQVLYYHKYPARTTAAIPGYTTETNKIDVGSISITDIDWSNMKDNYDGYSSSTQKNAVATLMQLCGSSVQMDYTSGGSGASSGMVPYAFKTYFDYDATTRLASRGDYRAAEWNELIYQELAANRPVYYSGQSTGGGHAFVIDGYDKDGLFHVNWGWGGYCDNYFLLSILDPESNSGIGASSSSDGYSFSQDAMIEAKPNTGEPFDDVRLSIDDISSTLESVSLKNGSFKVYANIDGLWSRASETHTFDYGLGMFDSDGQLLYAQNNGNVELDSGWGYTSVYMQASFPSQPDGKYQITAICRETGTDTWTRTIGGNFKFLTATVSGNTMTIKSPVTDLSTNMTVIGNRQFNTEHKMSATIQNNGTLFANQLFLRMNGEDLGGRYFEVDADESETIDFIFTPTTTGKKIIELGYYTYYYEEATGWQEEFHQLASTSATFGTEPENTYSVAGAPETFFGAYWDQTATDTEMTRDGEYTFVWKKEYVELKAGKIEFKVVVNHSWNESYPANNYELNIPQDGTYIVTINFNEETKTVWASAVRVNVLADAQALAADDDAVAVGKLRKAIEEAIESGDESGLANAIEQFKADNADQEKDETAKVATDGWKKFDGTAAGICATQYAPAISTYDGRSAQLAEVYENNGNRTGTIIYQDIEGLTNGSYKVGFFGNAFSTSERDGFECTMSDGAEDVAYVFANDQKAYIVAHIATSTTENDFRQFDVEVTDGTIRLGMGKDTEKSTNWHTMQIYQLTWFVTAKALYATKQAELSAVVAEAEAMLTDNSKPNGKEDLQTAINAAKPAIGSNMYNNNDIEELIRELKAAIAAFKRANWFIDFTAGEYYIIHAQEGLKMAAGHDWGTRGIINETGLDLILTPYEGSRTFTIDSRVSNGGNSHFLGNNLYMDSSEWGWALESQGSGFFYIIEPDGGKYINIDNNFNLVLSDTPCEWIIVSKEGVIAQQMEELAKATTDNPVDATFLLQSPNFNRNDQRTSAWSISGDCTNWNLNGGNNVNNCGESYHSTFTISQAISDAPAGIYKLVAQGFYRQDDDETEEAPVFFIGDKTGAIGKNTNGENGMSDASESFTNGMYAIEPIEVKYYGNRNLEIGVKGTATQQWVIFDNFQLTYYGPFEIETYTVAGAFLPTDKEEEEASFFGEAWTPTIEENDLMMDEYGTYSKTFENVELEAGTIFYKVVADHSWYATSWGFDGENAEYVLTEPGKYNVTFYFDPNNFIDPTGQYNLTCDLVPVDNPATGITSVAASAIKNNAVYNLNGQRVTTAKKGFYIFNGKKQVVK